MAEKQPAAALLAMTEPQLGAELEARSARREGLLDLAANMRPEAPGADALARMIADADEAVAEVCLVALRRLDAYAAVDAVFDDGG